MVKKYFAIAFVIMVVLLLVLRKQTEPTAFAPVQPETTAANEGAPVGEAAPLTATDAQPPVATPTATATPATSAATTALTPEALEKIRSLAKSSLASGYTAQRAIQAEWDRYTSDLVYIGWEPSGPDVSYKMGFLAAIDAPLFADGREKPERFTTDAFINRDIVGAEKLRYTPAAERINLNDYARYCERGCIVAPDWFEMLLAIPLDDQGHVDVWTINDKKEMKQVVDGMAR